MNVRQNQRLSHKKNSDFSKKSLGSIVAISLLLVVSVVATVGFQDWLNSYQNNIFSNTEQENQINTLEILKLVNNKLYIKSNSNQYLKSLEIFGSNGISRCKFKEGVENNIFNNSKNNRLIFDFNAKNVNSSNVRDLSGNNHNGIIQNNVNCNFVGVNNNSCFFENNTIEVLNFSSFDNNSDYTISFYFYINKVNLGDDFVLLLRNSKESAVGLEDEGLSVTYRYNSVKVYLYNLTSVRHYDDVINNPELNTWYHLVIVSKKDLVKTYLNSEFVDEIYVYKQKPHNYFFLGKYDENYNNGFFDGSIDELSIYNRSLNEDEISDLFFTKRALLYEQLIPKGVKSIDISSCNLEKNKRYQVLISTNDLLVGGEFVN